MKLKTDTRRASTPVTNNAFRYSIPVVFSAFFSIANASTIGITNSLGSGNVAAYSGQMTVSQELLSTLNNADYRLAIDGTVNASGNSFNQQIRYVPTFAPLTGDILTFRIVGAKFNASNLSLYAEESAAGQGNVGAVDINKDGDTNDVVELASLFSSVDPLNGYDTFIVRFNNNLTLPAGIEMILQDSAPVDVAPADGQIDDRSANSPAILIDSEYSGANITLSISGTNLFGTTIPNAAASGIIADISPQFSFNVSTPGAIISNVNTFPGTSVIDVSSDAGTEFTFINENPDNDFNDSEVKQGDANDDSDDTLSAGFLTISNDIGGMIEDTIALTSQDSLQVILTSTNGVGQLDLLTSEVQFGTLSADDVGYTFEVVDGEDQLISVGVSGDVLPATGNEVTDKVIIGISGTERVEERRWFTSGVLSFSGINQRLNDVTFSPQLSHIWQSNATTLHTPYVNLNPNYRSRIVLTNNSTRDVEFEIFAQSETDIDVTFIENQKTGTIPANANLVLFATDIITATNAMGDPANRASFSFVLAGPSDALQGVVQFIDPTIGILSQQTMLRPGTN